MFNYFITIIKKKILKFRIANRDEINRIRFNIERVHPCLDINHLVIVWNKRMLPQSEETRHELAEDHSLMVAGRTSRASILRIDNTVPVSVSTRVIGEAEELLVASQAVGIEIDITANNVSQRRIEHRRKVRSVGENSHIHRHRFVTA